MRNFTFFLLLFFVGVFFTNSLAQNTQKTDDSKSSAKTESQTSSIKVTQINETTVKNILKPNGKILLVNFWATWCVPCREEFPDLVKFAELNREKIDFITISLDDLAEIKTSVPEFLAEMKADKFSHYLLKAKDEDAVIASIYGEWGGGLPFTLVYSEKGEIVFAKTGKLKSFDFKKLAEKTQTKSIVEEIFVIADYIKILNGKRQETLYFYENNWKPFREMALKKGLIHSFEIIETQAENGADFDLILITRYRNEEQYKNSEKNFEPILKELRPNGPLLKNELKPDEFRQNVFVKVGKTIVSSFIKD